MVLAQFGVFMAFITPIAISLAVRLGELAPNNQEYLGYITGAGAETGTQAAASASAAGDGDPCARRYLPGLRHGVAAHRRGCLRNAGVHSGALQGDSPGATEAELQVLSTHRAGAGAGPPD